MISSNSPIVDSNFQSELISPIDYQSNTSLSNIKDCGIKFDNEISYCIACKSPILDRVVLKVGLSTWHVRCLHCTDCGIPLIDKCYSKNDEIFCKDDFFRRFGTRCASCDEVIPASEVIRKAQNNIYHLECFACISCHRQLNTGEEFFLLSSRKLMCRPDFEIAKTKEQELDQGNKRPRTTITAKQLEALKKTYSESSKPARHVREQLSAKTGLDMRVVQVWFQNRRAKEKRMKKDAGRGCWSSPYFHGENGGSKVTSNKGDSEEFSDDQTNEPCDISYQSDVESDSEIFSCYGSSSNNNNNNNNSNNNNTNNSNSNNTNNGNNNANNNNNISTSSTNEESGNDKSSTILSPNSAEPDLISPTLNNPIPQPPFDMCHRHVDLSRDARVFPSIGIRDWMNTEHNAIFSTNAIIGNSGQPNMIPNFMNSLNMVPGAFSNIGLLHQVNFETTCRTTSGFLHQIDPNKSA